MSKELIEQLAKEHGADFIESGERLDQLYEGERTIKPHYLFSDDQLEAFAKAYQAAVPIDNGIAIGWVHRDYKDKLYLTLDAFAYDYGDSKKAIRALIPDTQPIKPRGGE